MNQIRVLVIDDSAFMRKMITNILTSDKRIQVVGTARNGKSGLQKIKELMPDVITLDIEMPVMDGLTTLEKIIDQFTLPVVMLSSVSSRAAEQVVQAMAIGAVDFIAKPSGQISLDIKEIAEEIISKVIHASEAKVFKLNYTNRLVRNRPGIQMHSNTVVAIGASTGGPRALQRVLTDLDSDFSSPIFIVQHMPATFTTSLAKRLNSLVSFHVKEAVNNEIVQNHTVYIAPGDFHMLVHKEGHQLVIKLTKTEHIHGHRPAVDTLFHSIANLEATNKIAIILTGMGRDGSDGVKQIKKTNPESFIIAEAEESAIIHGMPAAAVETNCVNQVIHLHKIGEFVSHFIKN